MGKLKKSYNICKPTQRQIKKQKKNDANDVKYKMMCNFLEKKYSNTINYKCVHCLQEAYNSVINDTQGYVTDDELIISSNNTLKSK